MGAYLIMPVYRCLLTISCVITNYNRKTSKIYSFKHVLLLFDADDVKKYKRKHCAFYRQGMFHNHVHMCKQLFSCDISRRCHENLLTPFS